jgi:hypothetical protein
MQRTDRKWAGGGFARYKFSDAIEPYAEVMVMDDYSNAQIAPSGDFGTTSLINCDNPMMSDQQRAIICGTQTSGDVDLLVLRRNVEGGPRVDQLRHVNYRLLGGVRGDFNPTWTYDLYGMLAKVAFPETYINDLHSARIQDALFVVGDRNDPSTWQCRSGNAGCVPWNIFTVGAVTPASTDYMATTLVSDAGTGTKLVNGTLRGDLGRAGVKFPSATEGIQLVFGGEVREIPLSYDDTYQYGLLGQVANSRRRSYTTRRACGSAGSDGQDKRVQDLSLELGYRYAHYVPSSQGAKNNSSYKALLSWAPVAGFKLRGGFNRAVRAPNVRELFNSQAVLLEGTADICAGANPTATPEQCARTGVPAAMYGHVLENPAGQYNSLLGGNPQLDVETADTWTGGFVWTPKSITGLAFTVDYYDIKIDRRSTTCSRTTPSRRVPIPAMPPSATWSTATGTARCGSLPTGTPSPPTRTLARSRRAASTSASATPGTSGIPGSSPSPCSAARCWRTGRRPRSSTTTAPATSATSAPSPARSGVIASGPRGTPSSRRHSPSAGAHLEVKNDDPAKIPTSESATWSAKNQRVDEFPALLADLAVVQVHDKLRLTPAATTSWTRPRWPDAGHRLRAGPRHVRPRPSSSRTCSSSSNHTSDGREGGPPEAAFLCAGDPREGYWR